MLDASFLLLIFLTPSLNMEEHIFVDNLDSNKKFGFPLSESDIFFLELSQSIYE